MKDKERVLYMGKAWIDAALKEGIAILKDGRPFWMGFYLIENKKL